ncbi:MAG: PKD domain-containing protein, partial [Bacteroidetes bacterium]
FILFTFILPAGKLSAQLNTTCPNSNFNENTFTGWEGCYGVFSNSCQTPGFLTTGAHPLHKIIPAPGWIDNVNTCNGLTNVFPGENYVARLGDTMYTGAINKAAELKYAVYVNSSSYLFIYRYAVVLQSGNHAINIQPDFRVQITNAAGNVLDSTCGYYHISAPTSGPAPLGWHICNTVPSGPAYWKDWTTVGMDLTPYFGQTIYITFKVRGCTYNTHFGYAYISAYCGYLVVHTAMCEGDSSATLTAPPGFTYLWSTGDTTASIIVPHPVTGSAYSCTLTALNGCQVTIYDTLTYTVITSNFTHGIGCATLPMQFNDSSYVSQNFVTGWHWDFGDASPPVTGNPNPTHIYSTSGNFNVTLISYSTEGCMDTITKMIRVDSLPVITNTALRQRICNNGITSITPTSTVSNTLYTWTTTVSSPNISGYSDNPLIPALFINQTLSNSGNTLDSVIYHFTPHSSLCTGPVTDFVVTVCPIPKLLNTPLLKTICDSINTNIVLTSNVDSTRFTWTCTANSGNNLSGYSDYTTLPGTLNISQVIYNSGYNIDTLHYHITGNAYGCNGPTYDYSVVVFPLPDLTTVPLNKSLCSQAFTNVPLTSNVAGTQFTWTCTPSGPGITGWANNAVPSVFLNQQLFNSNTTSGTVTYHITPHANNCDGHVYNYTVTVKPIPTVTNTINPTLCSGSTTNIILLSNMAGSTFAWTATGSSPNVNGYSNSSGPVITQTLTNSGFNIESVLYSVIPSNNGCTGNSSGITATVFPVADVYFTPVSQVLCSAQNTALTLASHVSGSTFTWNASGSSGNVNGFSPGSGNSIVQTLNNIGTTIETVTYTAQPTANSCPGTLSSAIVTVNPVPVVSYTLCHDNITTIAAQPMKLAGGIPLGGNYTGVGVIAGMFNPALAGIGNHTITYNYNNYLGCSRSATQSITVSNVPAFLCGDNLSDIRDNKQYPTVKLGTRCWMATNLNFGTTIPSTSMQRDNCINEKYCYNNSAVNCTSYGGLYQWDEMMRYDNMPAAQGFCPPGWHVPIENEWNSLFALYISSGFAGAPLKYTGYSGFNVFLSGVRHNNVNWDFINFAIMLWSSTEHDPTKAWAHGMNTINPSVSYYPSSKTHAFAVRCVQD